LWARRCGLAACAKRSNARGRKSALIPRAAAITAHTCSEDRQRAEHAGYEAYIEKPIDPIELIGAVATLSGCKAA
jgi:CheY-like chemotaxis protein